MVGQVCNLSPVIVGECHGQAGWPALSNHQPLTWLLSPSPRQVANLSYLERVSVAAVQQRREGRLPPDVKRSHALYLWHNLLAIWLIGLHPSVHIVASIGLAFVAAELFLPAGGTPAVASQAPVPPHEAVPSRRQHRSRPHSWNGPKVPRERCSLVDSVRL